MNQLYEEFLSYQKRQAAYGAVFGLMGFDQETIAPEGANALSSQLMGVLSGEFFTLTTDPRYREIVEQLAADDSLTETEAYLVAKTRKEIRQMAVIPKDEYEAYSELLARAMQVWQKARQNNDFASFAPVLSEVIAYAKKFASYQNENNWSIYDVILDQNEEGFLQKDLDEFFDLLKKEIVPLLRYAESADQEIRTDFLRRKYELSAQRELNRFLAEYVGYDLKRGVIGESAHPFTTELHRDDVRITTAFHEDMLESAIFSTIHESGHAMFEQDKAVEYAMVPAASISMGLHESQSRLYENMIGRNEAFWKPIYGKLQETFPENLSDVTLKEFVKAVNKPQASLIRTEADELTYCLHIMVRYEIEKKIFNEDYPVEKLPELWNSMYREYLGIEVPTDSEGLLQDIHWSQGLLGYFPSYALGNAIAAQLYHTMDQAVDVDRCLSEGRPEAVHEWLRENVHIYGGIMPVKKLIRKVTGEDFTPGYYVNYLKKKFTDLFDR